MSGCCGGGYEHSPLDDYFVDLVRREEQLAYGVQQHGEGGGMEHARDEGDMDRGGVGSPGSPGTSSPRAEAYHEEEEGMLDRAAHDIGRAIRQGAEYVAELTTGLRRRNDADDVLVTLLVLKGGGVVSPEELSAMYAAEPDRTEFLLPQFALVATSMVRQQKYPVAEGIASFLVAESARSPVFAVRAFLVLRMLASEDPEARGRFNTVSILSAPSSPAVPSGSTSFQMPGVDSPKASGNGFGDDVTKRLAAQSPGRHNKERSSPVAGDEFIYLTMLAIRDAAVEGTRDHLGEAIERATAKHQRNKSSDGLGGLNGGDGDLGASLSEVSIDVRENGSSPRAAGHARSASAGLSVRVSEPGGVSNFPTPQTPFEAQLLFIEQIMDNCESIQGYAPHERQGVLESELAKVQGIVDKYHVWPPHLRASDVLKSGTTDVPRIVRLPVKNCRTFNSKARVPFLCYTEVLTKGLSGGHYDEDADYLENDGPMSKLAKNFAQAAEDVGAFMRGTVPKDRSSMESPKVNNSEVESGGRRRHSAGGSQASSSPYTEVSTTPRNATEVELDTPGRVGGAVLDPRDEDHEYDEEEIHAMETSEGALGMKGMPVAKGMVRHEAMNEEEAEEAQFNLREHFNVNRRVERIRCDSPFGNARGWRLDGVIVKNQDDLRQELLALQLVGEFRHIFLDRKIKCWVRPYDIVPVTATSGFLELVLGCKSVHEIKEDLTELTGESHPSLVDYWKIKFGHPESKEYKTAIRKFLGSCAAYAVITFLLRMKDRHNGNIMIDDQGHLVHIDFGFMLTNTPGGTIGNSIGGFERAPFKLTPEMVMLMGGPNSRNFRKFRELCIRCYLQARRKRARILALVDIFGDLPLPCFSNGGRKEALEGLTARFAPNLNTLQAAQMMSWLIDQALGNYSTKLYDQCQACMQGIRY